MFEIEIINVQFSIHIFPDHGVIPLIIILISKFFLSYFQRSKTQIMGMSQSIMNLFDVSSRIKPRCFTGRVVCTCISLQGA